MPLHITNPIWLVLLLALVPTALMWRRYLRAPGVYRLLHMVAYLRVGALICLVLALAGAQWMTRQRAVDLIFLADVSESMTPGAQQLGLEFVRTAVKQLKPRDRAGLIAFGQEALIDQPLGARLNNLKRIEAIPGRGETDLEAALQLALATSDKERNVRFVVLSDGLNTRGDAESLLPLLRERHIPVDAFAFYATPAGEASIEQVIAPSRVGKGQPFSIRVVTASMQETMAKLRLFRNGTLVSDKVVALQVGRNVFDYAGFKEDTGVNTFEARLETPTDHYLQNNVGYVTVTVEGVNRLLLITDSNSASASLLAALRQQGMRVDVTNTTALPASANALSTYGVLLLHDVSALKLSLTQQTQIASYVRDLGGGLVVIGGHNSYGLGGYFKTPLETILPVTMDAPQTLIMPSLAMVLVIDKSGSMAQTQGKLSKVDLAKEASLGVLDVMSDRDLFGVLAFESETRWIVPLQSAIERQRMAQQIGTLTADGGTDMGPAMLEALRVLNNTPAMVKHMIILTDGQSLEHDFASTTARLKAVGITVSTVAIGEDSDRELLQNIAKWGAGRYYYTSDIRSIPQIFTTEALVVSRPLAVEGRFKPQQRQPAAFLSGINQAALPPLDGYVLTSPKATSTVHLETSDQSPILASWRHGLGRVVAFTSGATNTWAANWLRWSGFGSFWSQTARWAMRPASSQALRPYFDIHEGQGSLVVDAVDSKGQFINFLRLQAEVLSPSGTRQTLQLVQTAPGQYQVTFPTGEQGAWLAAVADGNDPRFKQPTVVGTVLPYPAEYRLTGIDSGALERLTKLSGGLLFNNAQVPTGAQLRALLKHPEPVQIAVPLVTLLLFLAFLLFVIDICLRYLPPAIADKLEQRLRSYLLALRKHPAPVPSATTATEITSAAVGEEPHVDDAVTDAQAAGAAPREDRPTEAYTRLEDLVNRKRTAERTARPHYDFGVVDPAKAAAQYLARLRSAKRSSPADKPNAVDGSAGEDTDTTKGA